MTKPEDMTKEELQQKIADIGRFLTGPYVSQPGYLKGWGVELEVYSAELLRRLAEGERGTIEVPHERLCGKENHPDTPHVCDEPQALTERSRAAGSGSPQGDLLAALKGYEQWEVDLLNSSEAWHNGGRDLPEITQELWDKLLALQAIRNASIANYESGGSGEQGPRPNALEWLNDFLGVQPHETVGASVRFVTTENNGAFLLGKDDKRWRLSEVLEAYAAQSSLGPRPVCPKCSGNDLTIWVRGSDNAVIVQCPCHKTSDDGICNSISDFAQFFAPSQVVSELEKAVAKAARLIPSEEEPEENAPWMVEAEPEPMGPFSLVEAITAMMELFDREFSKADKRAEDPGVLVDVDADPEKLIGDVLDGMYYPVESDRKWYDEHNAAVSKLLVILRRAIPQPVVDVEREKRIREIRERESKATTGPWCWDNRGEKCNDIQIGVALDANDTALEGSINNFEVDEVDYCESIAGEVKSPLDADFIAHARADIPFLLEQLAVPQKGAEPCPVCHSPHPCQHSEPTVHALITSVLESRGAAPVATPEPGRPSRTKLLMKFWSAMHLAGFAKNA